MEKNLCKCTVGSGQQGGRPGWAAMQKVPPPLPSLLRPSYSSPRSPQFLLQFPPLPPAPLLLLPSDRWLEQVEAAHRLTCTAPQSSPCPPKTAFSPLTNNTFAKISKNQIKIRKTHFCWWLGYIKVPFWASRHTFLPGSYSSHLHLPKLSLRGKNFWLLRCVCSEKKAVSGPTPKQSKAPIIFSGVPSKTKNQFWNQNLEHENPILHYNTYLLLWKQIMSLNRVLADPIFHSLHQSLAFLLPRPIFQYPSSFRLIIAHRVIGQNSQEILARLNSIGFLSQVFWKL